MKKKIKKLTKNKTLMLVLVIGLLAIIIAAAVIIPNIVGKHNIKKIEDLHGTYAYIETVTNDEEVVLNIKVKIIFKDDKTAIFETSNGYSSEMTKGTYEFKNGEVTYTKKVLYDAYEDKEEPFTDEHTKTVTFKVYKNNKLKQTDEFYEQTIILERVN